MLSVLFPCLYFDCTVFLTLVHIPGCNYYTPISSLGIGPFLEYLISLDVPLLSPLCRKPHASVNQSVTNHMNGCLPRLIVTLDREIFEGKHGPIVSVPLA